MPKFIELATFEGNRYFNIDHIVYFEVNQGNPQETCWMYLDVDLRVGVGNVSKVLVNLPYRVMIEFMEGKGFGV